MDPARNGSSAPSPGITPPSGIVLMSSSRLPGGGVLTSGGMGGIANGGAGSSPGSSSGSSSSPTTTGSISGSLSVTVNSISGSAATAGGAKATTPLSSFSTFPLAWLNSSSTNNFAPAPFFPFPFSGFTGGSTTTGSGTSAFSFTGREGILNTGLNLQIK